MKKELDQIRISTGAKKICVNDEGDFITLQLGDQAFLKSVYELMKEFDTKTEEASQRIKDITQDTEEEKEYRVIGEIVDTHVYYKTEIDKIFGVDTCKKVFGDIVPSMTMIAEFLEAIEPYFNDYAKKEQQKIQKYSANRV